MSAAHATITPTDPTGPDEQIEQVEQRNLAAHDTAFGLGTAARSVATVPSPPAPGHPLYQRSRRSIRLLPRIAVPPRPSLRPAGPRCGPAARGHGPLVDRAHVSRAEGRCRALMDARRC